MVDSVFVELVAVDFFVAALFFDDFEANPKAFPSVLKALKFTLCSTPPVGVFNRFENCDPEGETIRMMFPILHETWQVFVSPFKGL